MSKSAKLALAAAAVLGLSTTICVAGDTMGLGRPALPEEIRAWDIDVRPDGVGLPKGHGTVEEGETLYAKKCAACHGEFGEGAGRWPVLAGGQGSLKSDRPEKTIGSFWPYASTVFDYVNRAMPFGDAQSLNANEVYAITAYLLKLNDIDVKDDELSSENFPKSLPNTENFFDDDRETTEKAFWKKEPCMTNCKDKVEITKRAQILDVTPEGDNKDDKDRPKGGVD